MWCVRVILHMGPLRSRTIERRSNRKCSLFLGIIIVHWATHSQLSYSFIHSVVYLFEREGDIERETSM